jgi:hypothetical protein
MADEDGEIDNDESEIHSSLGMNFDFRPNCEMRKSNKVLKLSGATYFDSFPAFSRKHLARKVSGTPSSDYQPKYQY